MAAESTRQPPEHSLAPADVLLVDDDEQWARATAALIESADETLSITIANSLTAAKSAFSEATLDCVVCDYQLGDGTGLELHEHIQAKAPALPFLLITGRGDEAVASKAIGQGVTDYIPKSSDDDQSELLANTIRNAVESFRTKQQLTAEQRMKTASLDLLTATNNLGDSAAQLCHQLVDQHEYAGAWIGTPTTADDADLLPQAVAGCQRYLDSIQTTQLTVCTDNEPAVRAAQRGEPVIKQVEPEETPVTATPDWQSAAHESGFETAGGFPIRHDGVEVGVLAVYGGTDGATVIDRNLESLSEYTDVIGFAHRLDEWQNTQHGDTPINIQVEVTDQTVPLIALEHALAGDVSLTVRSVIHRDDEIIYLTQVPDADRDELTDAADTCDRLQLLDFNVGNEDGWHNITATGGTPAAHIAEESHCQINRITVDSRTETLTAQIATHHDISAIIDRLDSRYESASVSLLETTATSDTATVADTTGVDLTDKQRQALEYTYYAGYFQRPREITATEVAERLGISRPTLAQHLRAGQRKLLKKQFE
jgi:FixJ family two-component response regulator/DNA-binding CsgD family transcriptional regulator